MRSLEVYPGVHRQAYRIDFSSSSLCMFFPVLSGSLFLLFKVFWLEGWLNLPLPLSAMHFFNWVCIQGQVRQRQRERKKCSWWELTPSSQNCSVRGNYPFLRILAPVGFHYCPPQPPPAPLPHDCLRDRQERKEKRKRSKGGSDFHILF